MSNNDWLEIAARCSHCEETLEANADGDVRHTDGFEECARIVRAECDHYKTVERLYLEAVEAGAVDTKKP